MEALRITSREYNRTLAVETKNMQIDIGLLLAKENAKRTSIEELKRQAKQKSVQAEALQQQKKSELKQTEENLN